MAAPMHMCMHVNVLPKSGQRTHDSIIMLMYMHTHTLLYRNKIMMLMLQLVLHKKKVLNIFLSFKFHFFAFFLLCLCNGMPGVIKITQLFRKAAAAAAEKKYTL